LTGGCFDGDEAWSRWAESLWTAWAEVKVGGVAEAARSNFSSQHPATAARRHSTAATATADRGRDGVRA
jgi:hypothetical protein